MLWLLVPAALVLVLAALTYIAYRIPFYSPLPHKENIYDIPPGAHYASKTGEMVALIREIAAVPCEEVDIISYDGTPLSARYYHVADGAPLQIQFHGWHGSAIRDFCGGNKLARECGFNTIVPDQRAHGKSGGRTITFGLRERFDCLAWIDYACQRFPDTPIVLAGVSMGASTVLMAAGQPLPPAVKGVIADCPFSSPAGIIKKVCRDAHIPPAVMFPFVRLGARLFGRFHIDETDVIKEIKKATVPVLLLHGEADGFVPCDMSREIFDACPTPKMRLTFPGADHGISYIQDPEGYARAVERFLDEMVDIKIQAQPAGRA